MGIEELRREIDRIDREILRLLQERLRIAKELGRQKLRAGMRIEDAERERRVIERALENAGELSGEFVRDIFERIILESKRAQRQGKVAILGPRGTFSEEAALRFMSSPELVTAPTIQEVIEMVERGEVEYGVVPVENSVEGSVGLTLEMLMRSEVRIYSEVVLDVNHCLLALPGVRLEQVRRVMSHPQALAQCRGFISSLGATTQNTASTADACREIREKGLRDAAAIAPRRAADIYGLAVLRENVQDVDGNQTRFFIVSSTDHAPTGRDKTSVVLALRDKPGALYRVLEVFAERGVNLTRIESRPSRRALGDYLFFIDFEGHRRSREIEELLEVLRGRVAMLRVLGSYPAGA